MTIRLLGLLARHGRYALLAGLAAGLLLPDLAAAMRVVIAPMIAALLFLAVLRVGPEGVLAGLQDLRGAIGATLVLQTVLPLLAAGGFAIAGVLAHPLAMGIVLVLAAAPVTGSPNFVLLLGSDPAPALRQLVLGTALLPLTVLPVFLTIPAFGGAAAVAGAAARLLALIAVAGGIAFVLRARRIVPATPPALQAIDGMAALLLGLVVIGVMSAIGPALQSDPAIVGYALAVAFALNLSLQIACSWVGHRRNPPVGVTLGVAAGNRNAALFLGILPDPAQDAVMLFIGCYQIPMYLTPFLLARWYRRHGAGKPAEPAISSSVPPRAE